jgi:dihydroorotate dehydrogenase (fumarate)
MRIGTVLLDSYVMNASGPNDTTREELAIIRDSGSAAIVMKSATIEARTGNREPRYARLEHGSIQAMGLPNEGYRCEPRARPNASWIETDRRKRRWHEHRMSSRRWYRPSTVSVDLIELNLSCPNIEGKRQIGYDFAAVEAALRVASQDHDTRRAQTPCLLREPPVR